MRPLFQALTGLAEAALSLYHSSVRKRQILTFKEEVRASSRRRSTGVDDRVTLDVLSTRERTSVTRAAGKVLAPLVQIVRLPRLDRFRAIRRDEFRGASPSN